MVQAGGRLPREERRITQILDINDLELGWLSGIIEGEGSVWFVKRPKKWYVRLEVSSTDRDVIQRIQDITSAGKVTSHKRVKRNHKRCYRWNVNKQNEVERILRTILPMMCKRRTARIMEWFDLPVELRERTNLSELRKSEWAAKREV